MKTWLKAYWPDLTRILTFVIILVLLIIGINGLSRGNTQNKQLISLSNQIKTLTIQNNTLSQQNKSLSEQNQQLATENQQHIDCIANLFAKFTRDGRGITIDDLTTCMATETTSQPPLAPSGGTTSTTTLQNKNTTQNSTSQSGNSQSSQPGVVERGLHNVQDFLKKVTGGIL